MFHWVRQVATPVRCQMKLQLTFGYVHQVAVMGQSLPSPTASCLRVAFSLFITCEGNVCSATRHCHCVAHFSDCSLICRVLCSICIMILMSWVDAALKIEIGYWQVASWKDTGPEVGGWTSEGNCQTATGM